MDSISTTRTRMALAGALLCLMLAYVAMHVAPWARVAMMAALGLALFVFVVYRLAVVRVRKVLRRNSVTEHMMRQALNMGDFNVLAYNLKRNLMTNLHGHSVPAKGVPMNVMMQRVHPDDRIAFDLRPATIRKLKAKPYHYQARWNMGTEESPVWRTFAGYYCLERGRLRQPKNIIVISRDVTDDMLQEKDKKVLTDRYMMMFESALVPMSFYDKDGHLLNLNESMKKLVGVNDENLKFFWDTNIFDTPAFSDLPHSLTDYYHTCSRMYFPSIGIDKYVEQRVRPVPGSDGKLALFVVTARDVTAEREMYLELSRQDKALREAGEATQEYAIKLRTLLENSNMYVFHADTDKGIIHFSRTLNEHDFSMTLEEYFKNIDDQTDDEVRQSFIGVLKSGKPFDIVHLFHRTPVSDSPTWYAVSGMPLTGPDGRVNAVFGMVRNVHALMEAQQKLREETARAENSTVMKATFLANMTHEIRTPLNAIVGFSDLLQTIDDAEERKQLITIIHNNCDMLMRLINDILEASALDAKPLAIVPRQVDFAKEFTLVCQSLSQRVQNPDVRFIMENPARHFNVIVDMDRIQQVITNFVTNAVKYTSKGHIRVGWRRHAAPEEPKGRTGIYIYCEDTGTGIPKEKQAHVFDRFYKLNDFVQGTGLGLAICKSIAQGCGGQIGLESKGEGKGCTFWIWIPTNHIAPQQTGETINNSTFSS